MLIHVLLAGGDAAKSLDFDAQCCKDGHPRKTEPTIACLGQINAEQKEEKVVYRVMACRDKGIPNE